MNLIDVFLERHSQHSKIFNDICLQINELNLGPEQTQFYETISIILKRIEKNFMSLVLICKTEDLYSGIILYRSILEIYVLADFLIIKCTTDNEYSLIEIYNRDYLVAEFLSLELKYLEKEDFIKDIKTKKDLIKHINEKYSNTLGFTKEHQRELSNKMKNFGFREMIEYLRNHVGNNDIGNIILDILPEYALTSSYVHGGPFSSSILEKYDANGLKAEIERIIEISFIASKDLKEKFILHFSGFDIKLHEQYTRLLNLK